MEMISVHDLAFLTSTNESLIKELLEYDLIETCMEYEQPCFYSDVIPRVCKIFRLHFDLGVSFSSMDLVLNLLERIENLEQRN